MLQLILQLFHAPMVAIVDCETSTTLGIYPGGLLNNLERPSAQQMTVR